MGGNVLGRVLCMKFTPGINSLVGSFVFMTASYMFLGLNARFPWVVADAVPYGVVAWVMPGTVCAFQICVGLFGTGLFVNACESAKSGKCPDSLPATIGFFGQLGCVSGN